MKRFFLLFIAGLLGSLLPAVITQAQQVSSAPTERGQSQVQIDAKSQPAVDQLAAVAHAIKECPREVTSERQSGKKPTQIERWYMGPPFNVVWDVVPGSSVRSPYLGFIEFSLSEDHWAPGEGFSLTITKVYPLKKRYEFDLGPSGLELTKMLRGGEREWLADSPDDTCWQKAARNAHAMWEQSVVQTAAEISTASLISSAGTVFLYYCDTENLVEEAECKLWLSGVYYGLATVGLVVDGTTKEAAKTNAICLPGMQKYDDLFHLVLKYIKNHPAERDQPTAALALAALREAFPCKQ
jgi:hypothetical protein